MIVNVTPKMRILHNTFKKTPAFIISVIGNFPDANTTIFGGVATGKQNAQEHAIAVGIINVYGDTPAPVAILAEIGIINELVAVLLVKHVMKLIKNVTRKTCVMSEICNEPNISPRYCDNPLETNPCANAKPPPNKNTISYGI